MLQSSGLGGDTGKTGGESPGFGRAAWGWETREGSIGVGSPGLGAMGGCKAGGGTGGSGCGALDGNSRDALWGAEAQPAQTLTELVCHLLLRY